MSLKQGRRNCSWASRLLAALFRPFMPEEAPPELPYLLFNRTIVPTSMAVTSWYSGMVYDKPNNRYLMCLLSRIDYCRCTDGTKHDFLLFYFRHWISGSSAEAVVCVDRRTVEIIKDCRQSSEISSPSPSSKETATSDLTFLLGSPYYAVRYLRSRYGRYKKLCTLTFSSPTAPSAFQVAAILCLVHQQAPPYHLYERQSYWYADSVWMSLKNIFAQNRESCKDHNARSHYRGVTLGPSPATVQAVCAAFLPEWQKTMGKLTQTRQRHEANLAQIRQEAFAEAMQAADERVRRAQQDADERQQAAHERVRRAQQEADERQQVAYERLRRIQQEQDERQQVAYERIRRIQAETEQLLARLAALQGKTTAI
ncbi:hypothetical protein DEU56DRAFT_931168 [Suillus clintonianus]|uniref:uncharacterized protein n=1 Tax=Suillus clintonianus TaxID=1904413 RepID=UPI001B85C641|nr:uncharacterized protein DEU56DRAFT_931168 [Suillus clintonianus]KAG2146816.1 hypothetical protein DEU56DRAFT_931168 [Suillus clintonianus]